MSAWLGSSAWSRGEDVQEKPSRPLASYVPLGDLVAYAEFQGLDAHAAGYSKTTASWLLNEKKGLETVREVIRSTLAFAFLATSAEGMPRPSELIAAGEQLLRKGCACGLVGTSADSMGAVLVIRDGAHGPLRALFDLAKKGLADPKTERCGDGTLVRIPDGPVFWVGADDLVLMNAASMVARVQATIERNAPSALDDPTRTRLLASKGFENVACGFVDVERLAKFFNEAAEKPNNEAFERTRPTSITFVDGGELAVPAPGRLATTPKDAVPPVFAPRIARETVDGQSPIPPPELAVVGAAPAPSYSVAPQPADEPKRSPVPTVAPAPPQGGLTEPKPFTQFEPVPQPPGLIPEGPAPSSPEARQGLKLIRTLGLDALKRVEFVWGFDGPALASTVRVVAPSPRRGVLALFGGPGVNPRDLPKMPAIAHNFVVFALDVKQVEAKVRDLVRATDPEILENLDEAVTQASVRDEVQHARRAFEQVGPRVVLYSSTPLLHEMKSSVTKSTNLGSPKKPGAGNLDLGFKLDLNSTWHPVVSVETRDAETLRAELPAMIAAAQKGVATMLAGQVDAELPLAIKELKNPYAGYEIRLAKLLELAADQKMRAVVVTGPRAAALAGTRRDANDALRASESKIQPRIPSKPLTSALERLPSRLLALSVEDSVDGTLSEMNAWLSDDDEADEPDEGDAPRPAPAPAITPDEWRDRFVPIIDAAWADDDGFVIENRSMLPSPWPLALILLGL
ncbi:MAG: hypothetical protein KGM43_19315 [Planctomycetota bacterium]|nr:hypothetical protein [Planctomycetota bacterium]